MAFQFYFPIVVFIMLQRKEKKDHISKFGRHATDTGSPEVQISLVTESINRLQAHLQIHAKDNHSRRGIYMMVAKRRRLLNYLKQKNPDSYQNVLVQLELRK
jgi:small subunit ribosomal protein S15